MKKIYLLLPLLLLQFNFVFSQNTQVDSLSYDQLLGDTIVLLNIDTIYLLDDNSFSIAANEIAPCPNGNLEYGSFIGWQTYNKIRTQPIGQTSYPPQGLNLTIPPMPMIHEIVPGSNYPNTFDSNVLTMPLPNNGTRSLRLGRENSCSRCSQGASYNFDITNDNKNFSLYEASVLYNPDAIPHEFNVRPYYLRYILVHGVNTNFGPGLNLPFQIVPNSQLLFVGSSGDPRLKTIELNNGNQVVYKNWSQACVDLSPYVGKNATIYFETGHCDLGAPNHFAYTYIDDLCGGEEAVAAIVPNKKILCSTEDIIADASASKNESDYFISIVESDANWNVIGTEYSEWILGEQAGVINYTNLLRKNLKRVKCNTYYRIKIAVSNCKTPWVEKVELVYINCPEIDMGPRVVTFCCNSGKEMNFSVTYNEKWNYDWVVRPSVGFTNGRNYINFGTNSNRTDVFLKVTDANGCVSVDTTTIFIVPPVSVKINAIKNCCIPKNQIQCCNQYGVSTVDCANSLGIFETLNQDSKEGCCSYIMESIVEFAFDKCQNPPSYSEEELELIRKSLVYEWNGQVAGYRVAGYPNKNYELKVLLNGCPAVGANYTVPDDLLHGPIGYLYAYTGARASTTPIVPFYIIHVDPALTVLNNAPVGYSLTTYTNAYNAHSYILRIFNRWGTEIKTIYEQKCVDGFLNRDIQWDLTDNGGNLVPQGVYVWKVSIFNCDNKSCSPAKGYQFWRCTDKGIDTWAERHFSIITGRGKKCKKWGWLGTDAGDVTVVY